MLVCAVDWKACRKELCHADAHVPFFPNVILQPVRTNSPDREPTWHCSWYVRKQHKPFNHFKYSSSALKDDAGGLKNNPEFENQY